jgi:hypothetical protein
MKTIKAGQRGGPSPLRHVVAALADRTAKVLLDAPRGFSDFRASARSRSAGEILAHVSDLLHWSLCQARGEKRCPNARRHSWDEDADRLFAVLREWDEYLALGADLYSPAPEKLFQRAVQDAVTHLSQIAVLRLLAEVPERTKATGLES